MRILLETIEQGHVQGTKWQTVLPSMLWKIIRLIDISVKKSLRRAEREEEKKLNRFKWSKEN